MRHRLFVDTNVMIDFLACRKPFYEAAKQIFTLSKEESFTLVVASLSFSTAAYVLEHKMTHEDLTDLLRSFSSLVEISSVDESVVKKSIATTCLFTDIEDAMQHYTALSSHCEMIITRNVKDFKSSSLIVCSPDEFLEELRKNKG